MAARKTVLVLVMILGLTLLVWAGVHNARERRLEQQKISASQAALMPADDGGTAKKSAAEEAEAMRPKLEGKAAPAFTLTTLEGKKVSLSDYKGRPVLLNFWATWCEPCKLEMPWLEEFNRKYAAQGFVILGIDTDDGGKSLVSSTVKKLAVTYPILLKNDKIEDQYDIEYAPESFYVDGSGKVLIATAGIMDGAGGKDQIEANIKRLIAASAK